METARFSFFTTAPPIPGSKTRVHDRDTRRTVVFGDGFVEDFEFGWSLETTLDPLCDDARRLLELAGSSNDQACIRAAIVNLVCGLEAYIAVALGSPPSQNLPAYNQALRAEFGARYVPPEGRSAKALARLFMVRHAIIHRGSRATEDVASATNITRNSLLEFEAGEVEEVIGVVKAYAASIQTLRPNVDPISSETET